MKSRSKIAIVAARGFGDGLMSLVLSNHLQNEGHQVTTFNGPIVQLSSWFPHLTLIPYPDTPDAFNHFDFVVTQPHSFASENLSSIKVPFKALKLYKGRTMVEGWRDLAHELGAKNATKDNGIVIPQELEHRKYKKRVLIHPMSLSEKRRWPFPKFLSIANWLRKEGWEPKLIMTKEERIRFPVRDSSLLAPLFPSLSELAAYVYESGFLIGNNSGVGHLASNLNVPTLSLFARESYASTWRPGWGPGEVVIPFFPFFGTRFKQAFWKNLLTKGKVKKCLKELVYKSIST
jgi:heptosyltransferase III